MNMPTIPTASSSTWYTKEHDLGEILADAEKDFDLPCFSSCLIKELRLSASTAGLFYLMVHNKQARGIMDIELYKDSSETSQIVITEELRYNDFDSQNKIYIRINNGSPANTNYKLVVKYV